MASAFVVVFLFIQFCFTLQAEAETSFSYSYNEEGSFSYSSRGSKCPYKQPQVPQWTPRGDKFPDGSIPRKAPVCVGVNDGIEEAPSTLVGRDMIREIQADLDEMCELYGYTDCDLASTQLLDQSEASCIFKGYDYDGPDAPCNAFGPLEQLVGSWEGFSGQSYTQVPQGDFIPPGTGNFPNPTEQIYTSVPGKPSWDFHPISQTYYEQLVFEPIHGMVRNRGFEGADPINPKCQEDQFLSGLRYKLRVYQTNPSTIDANQFELLHEEVGMYMYKRVLGGGLPDEEGGNFSVSRMSTIPHGVVVIADGDYQTFSRSDTSEAAGVALKEKYLRSLRDTNFLSVSPLANLDQPECFPPTLNPGIDTRGSAYTQNGSPSPTLNFPRIGVKPKTTEQEAYATLPAGLGGDGSRDCPSGADELCLPGRRCATRWQNDCGGHGGCCSTLNPILVHDAQSFDEIIEYTEIELESGANSLGMNAFVRDQAYTSNFKNKLWLSRVKMNEKESSVLQYAQRSLLSFGQSFACMDCDGTTKEQSGDNSFYEAVKGGSDVGECITECAGYEMNFKGDRWSTTNLQYPNGSFVADVGGVEVTRDFCRDGFDTTAAGPLGTVCQSKYMHCDHSEDYVLPCSSKFSDPSVEYTACLALPTTGPCTLNEVASLQHRQCVTCKAAAIASCEGDEEPFLNNGEPNPLQHGGKKNLIKWPHIQINTLVKVADWDQDFLMAHPEIQPYQPYGSYTGS